MKTFHVHIKGRVQGVGFRPFIYGLANEMELEGSVANTLEGVHIYVNCNRAKLDQFITQIRQKAPEQSLITSVNCEEVHAREFTDFTIIESNVYGYPDLLITPDFAICEACQKELFDPLNRRYNYSYITCTKCGPRFSIETDLPYDRQRTSMEIFKMCDQCGEEYWDPTDRRFYSQTNTCPDCQISQWISDASGNRLDLNQEETVSFICDRIEEGEIVAVKGIGGYLLMCDASDEKSVLELRKKKERPTKPFALMYPDIKMILENYYVSDSEKAELTSPQSSIVLLEPRTDSIHKKLLKNHAPELDRLGVMLPYAPLFQLILDKLQKPLLATSGNVKGSPITFQNEKSLEILGPFADHFLHNNREIQVPQDDSVVKFSKKYQQKIIIRRSRGYAPGFVQNTVETSFDTKVLAMGALLKSTFTLWQNSRCHVSQFLGDTTELESQVSYERTLNHFMDLLKFRPEVILVDKHPIYFSTHLGKELALDKEIKIKSIQHHEAHFWAVLGENNLLKEENPVLGVVLDGTGMGNDGAIWGSEFFLYHDTEIKRINHLQYYPHILGDKMALEPRLSALSILHAADCDGQLNPELFDEKELDFYSKVLDHSSLSTSSMGRLFDAVSCLLGLCQRNSYEGEAAMYLEKIAQEYCTESEGYPIGYSFEISSSGSINMCPAIKSILTEFEEGENAGKIAASFHRTVVDVIEKIASKNHVNHVAFSGGVMQNGLLVDMIIDQLGAKHKLYFHKDLSPNDECISYGQLVGYYALSQKEDLSKKSVKSKTLI